MQDTQFKNELIDIIDEKIAESGGGLPEVTDVDDGKVLGVDDGEWKAVEPSAGGNIILYMNDDFQLSSMQNGVLSPVSYNTLAAFISSGLCPVLCTSSEHNPVDMNLGYLFLTHSILNISTENYEAFFGASGGGTGILLTNANADGPLLFED